MKKKKNYIFISSGTMDPCFLTKELYSIADKTWLCTGCNYPKRDVKGIDITIQGKMIENRPLNVVMGAGIPVAKKEFLFSFGEDIIERDLYLGKIFNEDGMLMEEWVTFRGKRKLIVRGVIEAGYRTCKKCNRNCYFAMDKKYLYPEPPQDTFLFENSLFGLVFPEALYEKIKIVRKEK